MKRIKLGNFNKYFFVSIEDFLICSKFTWYLTLLGYVTSCQKGKSILLHRFLMGLKTGDKKVVDHINGNKLDNQRKNLRICKHSENCQNSKIRKDKKWKGYWKNKSRGNNKPFQAQIRLNGKLKHIGFYQTAKEAAKAYDSYAKIYYKKFAKTNF